jgi:DNA anti-recombination protein RmuC
MKPSQSISRENIDDEYDKLYKKCQDLQDRLDGADLAIGTASTNLQEAEAKLAKADDRACQAVRIFEAITGKRQIAWGEIYAEIQDFLTNTEEK